jgi:acetolactate synthase-1/3 small subunit
MTITVSGDDRTLEQVQKQLYKLISVVKIGDLTGSDAVNRELALIKVRADPERRAGIIQIVDIFRAKIVDVGKKSFVIEITGDDEKIDAMFALLREFGIQEVVRTGLVAMARGSKGLEYEKSEDEKGVTANGKSVLRSRRGLESLERQESGYPGLRQPGARTGTESQG